MYEGINLEFRTIRAISGSHKGMQRDRLQLLRKQSCLHKINHLLLSYLHTCKIYHNNMPREITYKRKLGLCSSITLLDYFPRLCDSYMPIGRHFKSSFFPFPSLALKQTLHISNPSINSLMVQYTRVRGIFRGFFIQHCGMILRDTCYTRSFRQ